MPNRDFATVRALTLVLLVAAVVILSPMLAPVVLAAWFADLLGPLAGRLGRLLGGRRRSAAAIIVLLATTVLVPLALGAGVLVSAVSEVADDIRAMLEGRGSVPGILLGAHPPQAWTLQDWADLTSRYGANAWGAVTTIARASASAILGAFVFLVALFTFTADGERVHAWIERNAPMPREVFIRFASAFRSTGRGLIVGTCVTALAQGAVATVAFAAMGIPRAFVLGPLTAVCAIVPVLGTGLVWAPLSIELAVTGDYPRALAVLLVGVGILSVLDNVLRPFLVRYGRLDLPPLVVLVSILGGLATFGATGAIVGPVLVRLAGEALAIARERRVFA